jgi:protein involved in polysaccharide export with SLBB domain
MQKGWASLWLSRLGLPLCLLLAGCSVYPGNRLTLLPENHQLLDSARAMRRQTAPEALPRDLDKHLLRPYAVEPGDTLLVQPADNALDSPVRLPADQPVLPDGTINLGRYGRLVVAGQTVDEIEAAVHAAVALQTPNPGPITVRVVARQSKVYYVLGDVNAPGAFQLTGRETVLDGLLAAGGLTDRASRRNIILSRPTPPGGCRIVLPVCYQEIVQLGDTTTNYQLAAGDRVYVPSRACWEGAFPSINRRDGRACCGPQLPCTDESPCADMFGAPFNGHLGALHPAPGEMKVPAPTELLPVPKPLPPASASGAATLLPPRKGKAVEEDHEVSWIAAVRLTAAPPAEAADPPTGLRTKETGR